jgi:carbon-monoxide dehydrogenase small subunit
MKQAISIYANGVDHHDEVEPRLLLVHYLRELLGLTGTHVGCETSICGVCTVLLDGQAAKSCTMSAVFARRIGIGDRLAEWPR